MLQSNRLKILNLFFDYPTKNFQLREISRRTNIAITSVKRYVNLMLRGNLIILVEEGIYPSYKANRDNDLFKIYKWTNLVRKIKLSGLLDYIYDSCLPDCIILFGSASRGEDIESSDIDLFIQAKRKRLSLDKYEKILNRKISLFFEENYKKLSKELKNNILNGIKLKGYLRIF